MKQQTESQIVGNIVSLVEQYFPPELQQAILQYEDTFVNLQEIRCRVGQTLYLRYIRDEEQAAVACVTEAQMQYMVSRISQGSAYAWEEEFRRGYLTLPGGYRVGLVGKGVIEHGTIRTLKQISALNFRIVRQIYGIGDALIPLLYHNQQIRNCLIVSPPGGGKTTLLRDVIRQLSNGVPQLSQRGRIIGVVDERSELAGSVAGIPQMDVGCRTDVLDGCPKSEGMKLLIRSMAPQIIAVDEIGAEADVQALEEATQSGVSVIATAHGDRLESLYKHPVLHNLIVGQYFSLLVFLRWNNGRVEQEVYEQLGGAGYEPVQSEIVGHDIGDWSRQCCRIL